MDAASNDGRVCASAATEKTTAANKLPKPNFQLPNEARSRTRVGAVGSWELGVGSCVTGPHPTAKLDGMSKSPRF